METENKFKNSPIHDKRAILEMMDELRPEQMVKVVDFIQQQVKLFCQPTVISSVCEHNNLNIVGGMNTKCLDCGKTLG